MTTLILPQVTALRASKNPPATRCRCCSQFAEVKYQKPMVSERMRAMGIKKPGSWIVTCKSQPCKLYNQTFSAETYAAADLSSYGVQR